MRWDTAGTAVAYFFRMPRLRLAARRQVTRKHLGTGSPKGRCPMNPTVVDTAKANGSPAVRDRVLDAARHAAHVSHEAKLLKSLATDAIEDGAYAAKRALKTVKRGVDRLGDLKDEAVHRVKRQPVKAIAIAAA